MSATCVLALFGWYVIYSNKERMGKMHNTTWHAWVGLACIGMYALMLLNGIVALHPDFGKFNTHKTIRAVHSYAGRLGTALGFLACAMGWYTMNGQRATVALCVP